jgi:anti-sigma B factor antagonist
VDTGRRRPPGLGLTRSSIGDGAVSLTVGGEMDMATAGGFAETVDAILAEPGLGRLVLDFGPLEFLDSSGVAALVIAERSARARNVTLTVVNCRYMVRRVLEITGLLVGLTGESTR